MSEERPACRISLHRLPEIHGKKSIKIEQFHARYWRDHLLNTFFCPRIPARLEDRNAYFAERYRVRIDGKWFRRGARFTMLTQAEVDSLVNGILENGQKERRNSAENAWPEMQDATE